jgi:hypothetical protein
MAVWLTVVCIVFIAVAVLALKKGAEPPRNDGIGKYKAGRLMTENEREFFGRLVAALPAHYIFPQVAIGALIVPSSTNKQLAHADRLRVAQQRVDFVVCDAACEVVAVVELDDRLHNAARDRRRDERLLQGGIRTVRFQSKNRPDRVVIRDAVLGDADATHATDATLAGTT